MLAPMSQGHRLTVVGLGVLLTSVSCDATPLASATGRHVTLHWDPDERQVCGGTLAYIDASLEIVAETYGVELAARPAIEVMWTAESSLPQSVCGNAAPGCAVALPNGVSHLFSRDPIDPHELTHTVRLAGPHTSLPSFFHEGVAIRWEHGFADSAVGKDTYTGNLDSEKLRELLDGGRIEFEAYPEAGFFWSWLEAEYGPERMAQFTAELSRLAPLAAIERSFEHSFGLSLDEAVEASAGHPLWMFDIHACAMTELAELEWTGTSLTLFDGPRDCAAPDVFNSLTNANRSIRLVVPEVPSDYAITITGDPPGQVRFDRCTGAARPFELALTYGAPSTEIPIQLAGEYIVTASALIDDDGRVAFPEARLVRP